MRFKPPLCNKPVEEPTGLVDINFAQGLSLPLAEGSSLPHPSLHQVVLDGEVLKHREAKNGTCFDFFGAKGIETRLIRHDLKRIFVTKEMNAREILERRRIEQASTSSGLKTMVTYLTKIYSVGITIHPNMVTPGKCGR
ncbi:hypothetical protein HDU67_007247 [Dinochytrium kinnereticum]|nr:hypothetical protein HDU67_007247 [Dinochytrium kinnereticum]